MQTKSGGKPRALHNLRWKIIGMILLATTINYIDRDALSVAEPYIRREFNLTPKDYGEIVSWFLLAYAVMQLIAGRLIDRVGTRLGFTLSIIWWSCANMLHGLATGVTSLSAYRFLLGIGEAGNFPAALKAIAEWFPPAERAKAVGILSAGPGLGSIIAKPLVAWLVLSYGWRWSFVVTGALGLLWLWGWRALYWPPREHPRISAEEAALLAEPQNTENNKPLPWLSFLSYRAMWGLMLARFISDGAFYFFVFWLPKYLNEARGFDLKQIGMFAWLPFLASDFGGLAGGWFGAWLAARGFTWSAARQITIWLGSLMLCVVVIAARVPSAALALTVIAVAMFATQLKAAALFTIPADLFRAQNVATAWGLSGAAGSFGAMLFQRYVGGVVQTQGYAPVFIIVAVLHLLSAVLISALLPSSSNDGDDPITRRNYA